MNFSEAERRIYRCPHTNRDYDPLAVKRQLTIHTAGKFGAYCRDSAGEDPVLAARAQEALTQAARKAFGLKPSPEPLDAVVWDTLIDFTRWLSGKGPRAQTTPNSVPSTASPRATDSTTRPTSG